MPAVRGGSSALSLTPSLPLQAKVLLHWVLFLAAISYNEVTSPTADGATATDASQDVLSVVAGTLAGGLLLALGVTYPAWRCWGASESLYG